MLELNPKFFYDSWTVFKQVIATKHFQILTIFEKEHFFVTNVVYNQEKIVGTDYFFTL